MLVCVLLCVCEKAGASATPCGCARCVRTDAMDGIDAASQKRNEQYWQQAHARDDVDVELVEVNRVDASQQQQFLAMTVSVPVAASPNAERKKHANT